VFVLRNKLRQRQLERSGDQAILCLWLGSPRVQPVVQPVVQPAVQFRVCSAVLCGAAVIYDATCAATPTAAATGIINTAPRDSCMQRANALRSGVMQGADCMQTHAMSGADCGLPQVEPYRRSSGRRQCIPHTPAVALLRRQVAVEEAAACSTARWAKSQHALSNDSLSGGELLVPSKSHTSRCLQHAGASLGACSLSGPALLG